MHRRTFLVLGIIFLVALALTLTTTKLTGFASVVSSTSVDVCQDSDAGKNINEKGIISGVATASLDFGKQFFSKEDYCSDANTLLEYSCIGDGENYRSVSESYPCLNGCSDGICLP